MNTQNETKKELSYDQVQRIIDKQIARIEEEEIQKRKEKEMNRSSNSCQAPEKHTCCVLAFLKRLFGRKK